MPGDLALNLDGDSAVGGYGYEYGVKVRSIKSTDYPLNQWDIYNTLSDDNWKDPYYIPENRPSILAEKTLETATPSGTAIGDYVQLGPLSNAGAGGDKGYPNYVIEMAIPKTSVGMSIGQSLWDPPSKEIHYVDNCGNDHIDNPIPEFVTIVIPVGMLVGLFLVLRKKHRERS